MLDDKDWVELATSLILPHISYQSTDLETNGARTYQ